MLKIKLYSRKLTSANQIEDCFVAGYISPDNIVCICDTVIGNGQPYIKCVAIMYMSSKTIYVEGNADSLISAISKTATPNPNIQAPFDSDLDEG